ncbi:MobF family relaxase [Bosea caraganae]|nr:MobF family relaxase [Bosea caraganae]
MLSPHRLGAGAQAAAYYTSDSKREARPDRRDDYYARDGGGVWWTTSGTVVRHDAPIDNASFRDLCAGVDPRTGQPLVRGAGPTHWAGVDLTMTPGKSVSVLWMAGTAEQRALIEAAHRQAIDEALGFIVSEGLIEVRSGAGGSQRHAPTDLIVARYDHYTTREGDPNLHTHAVVLNVAGSPLPTRSGRYRFDHLTIETTKLFSWQLVAGAAYRAALSRELSTTFGFAYREAGRGQWEIAGIASEVLAAFSKRSAQIEAYAGPDASGAQKEIAALATRRGKDLVPTGEELEARWQDELAALAADPWAQALDRARDRTQAHDLDHDAERPFDPPDVKGDGPVARAASILFRHESVIDRKALLQTSLELASLDGQAFETVEAELAALEREGAMIALSGDEPSARWTTPGIAAAEAAMLRAAHRLNERDWLTAEAMDRALARAPHLSEQQREAARHVLGRDGVTIVEAGAGTGKTTTARAIVDAARESGMTVVGLAPAWIAVDELGASTGIEAQAIARWRHDHDGGKAKPLDASTLIIVDEAGMVGTRDMEAVLTAAQHSGAKVLLLGDRRQLASVSGASALRVVADVVERSAVMHEVRRQEVDWQRAATVVMAQGDSEAGLRAYAMNDRIELVSGAEAAQDRVIALWQEQRSEHGDDVLIVTSRNADAASLNQKARQILREENKLGPDLIELRALDRSDKIVPLPLAVGDRLRFGETLVHHGIRNGHQAIVEAIGRDASGQTLLTLAHQDGSRLEVAWGSLSREPRFGRKPAPPKIVHALAGTAYAAQGRTAPAAVLYVARSTDAREVYVGLSRHRHDARVVVEKDRLDAMCRQRQADPRLPATATAILEKLFGEAARYREKSNVVDYVEDQRGFIRDGVIRQAAERSGIGADYARKAVRLLREAMSRLRLDRLSLTWPILALQSMVSREAVRAKADDLVARVGMHLGRGGGSGRIHEQGIKR